MKRRLEETQVVHNVGEGNSCVACGCCDKHKRLKTPKISPQNFHED